MYILILAYPQLIFTCVYCLGISFPKLMLSQPIEVSLSSHLHYMHFRFHKYGHLTLLPSP